MEDKRKRMEKNDGCSFLKYCQFQNSDTSMIAEKSEASNRIIAIPKISDCGVIHDLSTIEEKVIYVPKKIVEERNIVVPQVQSRRTFVEEAYPIFCENVKAVQNLIYMNRINYVKKLVIQNKFVEIPEVKQVGKINEVPQIILKDKIVELPKVIEVPKILQVPKIVIKETIVEVPRVEYRRVPIVQQVDVPQVQVQYYNHDVVVPKIVHRLVPVDKTVHVHVPIFVEKKVSLPVRRYHYVPKPIFLKTPTFKHVPVPKRIPRYVEILTHHDMFVESPISKYITTERYKPYYCSFSQKQRTNKYESCDIQNS